MSSAIGYYVHYNASRYMKYGITKNTPGKNVDARYWLQVRHDMMSRAKQIKTDKEIEELQEQYNTFRRMITLTDTKEAQKVRDLIAKMILEKEPNPENFAIDWRTGNIFELSSSNIAAMSNNIKTIASKNDMDKDTQLSYERTVLKRFAYAFNQLKGIQPSAAKENIKKALINLAKAFHIASTTTDISLRQMMSEGKISSRGIYKEQGKIITRAQAEAMVNNIRVLMGLNSTNKLAGLKGKFEEYVAAAAKLKAMGVATSNITKFEEELRKELNQYGGTNKTKTYITSDMMSLSRAVADELAKNKDYTLKDKEGTYRFKTSESEQKMDALFTWEGGPQEGIALSIKNYNLNSQHPISLVTKSPLSSFLFNMGNVDYTNHYLNIFAAHKNAPSAFRNMRTIAEESLSYYLLYAAMSGRGVGKKEGFADVFVVNDNSNKTDVKIYDIGKLVTNIVQRADALGSIQIDPSLSTINILNSFETKGKNIGNNIQRRLTKLIANTRAIKISVALGTNVFKDK